VHGDASAPLSFKQVTDGNWQKVREIFDAVLRRKAEERRNYLIEACGGDKTLLAEVESLLSSLGDASSFMETPAVMQVADVMEAETKPLEKGQKLGHYQIIEKIGEGGMGAVYLANDTRLERAIALKILPEKLASDRERMQRFVREAKSASALNHPNIITIYEIGESDSAHFIATEYIEGETLRERFKDSPLDLEASLAIAVQVAGALDAAHRAGIVHRDVKPENVMIRPDRLVKLLDFGIAKLTETQSHADLDPEALTAIKAQTRPGMIIGTAAYMSPEQAQGKIVDARSDIFSFGVMLYEMVTGKQPFKGTTAIETIGAILNKEPVPLRGQTPAAPHELERIINKALRKDRDERYQTAKDLLIDLKDVSRDLEFQNKSGRTATPDHEETKTQPLHTGTGDIAPHATSSAEYVVSGIKQHKRGVAIGLAVFLLAAVGTGVWFLSNSTASLTNIESIAVMPFVNETGDPQVEYLSDGMTDTLISSLSELPNLKVKARTSVFRYKGKEIDPKTIGKELGVQAIVNGRMTQRAGRTSVLLEVVDTESEDVIFSTKYDRPQSALVTLQSDIARDLSRKLKSKLSGAEEAKVTKTHTADPEALQLYLQGQFYGHKGGRSNVLHATDYFNKAIEKDPNYALAYAGLALNYRSYGLYNIAPPADYKPKAKAAAMRALELDDSLAEAHVALGKTGGDPEQEFRRAIELNPNYALAHDALCISLTYKKRFDEAIAECKKAQELDPSSSIVTTDLGAAYAFARRPDEAIEMLRRAHEMDPTLFVPLGYLGFAQTLKGQYTEAIATFRKAIEVSDGSPNAKSHLAYALAKAGQRDEALKLIDELKRQAAHGYVSSFHFAVPYIGLGNKDEAFFWLGKGVAEQSIGFADLELHPWYDDLRSDPRFKALLIRTNLPES
jgi:serine/threonine protein kinase/Flp pilus assembly protein TadD